MLQLQHTILINRIVCCNWSMVDCVWSTGWCSLIHMYRCVPAKTWMTEYDTQVDVPPFTCYTACRPPHDKHGGPGRQSQQVSDWFSYACSSLSRQLTPPRYTWLWNLAETHMCCAGLAWCVFCVGTSQTRRNMQWELRAPSWWYSAVKVKGQTLWPVNKNARTAEQAFKTITSNARVL